MSLSSLLHLPLELQVSCHALSKRHVTCRRYAMFQETRRARPQWRTAPYDPEKIAEAARPDDPMYYEWSKRANAGLKRGLRFGVIGFGLAAVITPALYIAAYYWTLSREMSPLHRPISEADDPDAARFRWAMDTNPAWGGAWRHQAINPDLPFSTRLYAIASAIAFHVALDDNSPTPMTITVGLPNLATGITVPRGFASAVANLRHAIDACHSKGLELPHRSVVELERNLAEVWDASGSAEAAKVAVAYYERILASLTEADDENFAACERARAGRRAGEIMRRLSIHSTADPVEKEILRLRSQTFLANAIGAAVSASAMPFVPENSGPSRIRDSWWPLRWLMGDERALRPQADIQEMQRIAENLSRCSADVAPSVARNIVTSAGLLIALSVQRGGLKDATVLTKATIDFLRRHVAVSCTGPVLSRSPSASLHAHWMNVNDAALHNNLAELLSKEDPDGALLLATSAGLQAMAESIALRARFSALEGSRNKWQKLIRPAGDTLEPLRRSVQETTMAADNTGISSQLLCGALYEIQGAYEDALAAYEQAKIISAGPSVDEAVALAEEKIMGGGLSRGEALYGYQWDRANVCARRVRAKNARSKGQEAPSLPPRLPKYTTLRQRLPRWAQNKSWAVATADFIQEEYDRTREAMRH